MFTIEKVEVTKKNLDEVITSGKYYLLRKGSIWGGYILTEVQDTTVHDILDGDSTIVRIDEV